MLHYYVLEDHYMRCKMHVFRVFNKVFVAFLSNTWYYIISCPDFRAEVSFFLSALLFLQSRYLNLSKFHHHHIDVVVYYEKYAIKCYKTLIAG